MEYIAYSTYCRQLHAYKLFKHHPKSMWKFIHSQTQIYIFYVHKLFWQIHAHLEIIIL